MQGHQGGNHPNKPQPRLIYNGVLVDVPGITGDAERPVLLVHVKAFCYDLLSGPLSNENVRFKTVVENAQTGQVISPYGVNYEMDLAQSSDPNDRKVAAALRCARNSLLDTAELDFQRERYFEENDTGSVLEVTPSVPIDQLPIVTLETVQAAIDAEFPNREAPKLDDMVRAVPDTDRINPSKSRGLSLDDYE